MQVVEATEIRKGPILIIDVTVSYILLSTGHRIA